MTTYLVLASCVTAVLALAVLLLSNVKRSLAELDSDSKVTGTTKKVQASAAVRLKRVSQRAKTAPMHRHVSSALTRSTERRMHEAKANPLAPRQSSPANLRRQKSDPLPALEKAPAAANAEGGPPQLSRHRSEPVAAEQRRLVTRVAKLRSCYHEEGGAQATEARPNEKRKPLKDVVRNLKRLCDQFEDMAKMKTAEMVDPTAFFTACQDPEYREHTMIEETVSASFASLEESKSFAEIVDTTCFHLGVSRFELWLDNKEMWNSLKTLWSEIEKKRYAIKGCKQPIKIQQRHDVADYEEAAPEEHSCASREVDHQHRLFKAQVTQHLLARVSGAVSGAIVTQGRIAVVS
jgi:hypothetical protein